MEVTLWHHNIYFVILVKMCLAANASECWCRKIVLLLWQKTERSHEACRKYKGETLFPVMTAFTSFVPFFKMQWNPQKSTKPGYLMEGLFPGFFPYSLRSRQYHVENFFFHLPLPPPPPITSSLDERRVLFCFSKREGFRCTSHALKVVCLLRGVN